MGIFAIKRRAGETVSLTYPGGRIEVTVAGVDGLTGQATLAIIAPPSVAIARLELEGRRNQDGAGK